MRNLQLILGAVAAICVSPSANAQSLDQVIGVISGASSLGYNPCAYVKGDTAKTLCQINRVAKLGNDTRNVVGNRTYREWENGNDNASQLRALQRACKAGDRISCERSGGPSPDQMEVAQALMDACRSGDKHSCRRIRSIMDR